jgi:hypothetical protein
MLHEQNTIKRDQEVRRMPAWQYFMYSSTLSILPLMMASDRSSITTRVCSSAWTNPAKLFPNLFLNFTLPMPPGVGTRTLATYSSVGLVFAHSWNDTIPTPTYIEACLRTS